MPWRSALWFPPAYLQNLCKNTKIFLKFSHNSRVFNFYNVFLFADRYKCRSNVFLSLQIWHIETFTDKYQEGILKHDSCVFDIMSIFQYICLFFSVSISLTLYRSLYLFVCPSVDTARAKSTKSIKI